MLQRIAGGMADRITRRGVIEEEDTEICAFGLECLLADLLQGMILLILSALLGMIPLTASVVVCFSLVKREAGGWHMNTHLGCILTMTGSAVGLALVCRALPESLRLWGTLLCAAAGNLLVFRLAPAAHPNNPQTQTELKHHRLWARLTAFLIGAAAAIWALAFPVYQLLPLGGSAGLLAAAVTLAIPVEGRGANEGKGV